MRIDHGTCYVASVVAKDEHAAVSRVALHHLPTYEGGVFAVI